MYVRSNSVKFSLNFVLFIFVYVFGLEGIIAKLENTLPLNHCEELFIFEHDFIL